MVPGNVSVPSEALAFFCEAVQKSLSLEKRKSCETVNGNFKVAVARHLIGSEVRTLICMSEWGERLSIVKERDPRHFIVSFDQVFVAVSHAMVSCFLTVRTCIRRRFRH